MNLNVYFKEFIRLTRAKAVDIVHIDFRKAFGIVPKGRLLIISNQPLSIQMHIDLISYNTI